MRLVFRPGERASIVARGRIYGCRDRWVLVLVAQTGNLVLAGICTTMRCSKGPGTGWTFMPSIILYAAAESSCGFGETHTERIFGLLRVLSESISQRCTRSGSHTIARTYSSGRGPCPVPVPVTLLQHCPAPIPAGQGLVIGPDRQLVHCFRSSWCKWRRR